VLHVDIRLAVGVLFAALLVFANDGLAAAESVSSLPATPEPEECQVSPRSVDELRRLTDEALRGLVTPGASPPATPSAPPTGEPADEAVARAVTATIRESIACLNAGNMLAAQALATDDAVRRELASLAVALDPVGGLDALLDDPSLAASPVPIPPELRGALIDVRDVQILPDGRVGAVVEVAPPTVAGTGGTREDYYVLKEVDGRFLIDELIVGMHQGERTQAGEPVGTPGP